MMLLRSAAGGDQLLTPTAAAPPNFVDGVLHQQQQRPAEHKTKEDNDEEEEEEDDDNADDEMCQMSPGGTAPVEEGDGHKGGEKQQQKQWDPVGAGDGGGQAQPNSTSVQHKQQQQPPLQKRPALSGVPFREKQFKNEAPLLEQYFDLNTGRHVVLFNFFAAVFVLVVMTAWAQDFQRYENPLHHLWLIAWNFHQLPQTLLVWSAMFCSTVVCPFYGIRLWHSLAASPEAVWPRVVLSVGYTAYQLAFFYYSIRAIFWLNLQGACSFIITCENTRIAMKIHSFFRENLSSWCATSKRREAKNGAQTAVWKGEYGDGQPSLGQFIYFMFSPTFIYRNSYPQSPTRSWRKVCRHMVGCLASMYFVSLCFSQWIIPHFSALSYPEDMRLGLLMATIFPSIIPGSIALFLGIFYGLLHSWLSMFAEALRFGDRRFYANWWSSRNMAEYYRNWNLVVHDWLYAYVYRDISMLLGNRWGGPALAQCLVFFLSSFFHEYWFAISLRMFYPAIFTLYFIFGGIFFLISRMIKRPYIWNTLMWWNLLIGTGMFVVCYASEWYARQRCAPVYQNALVDTIIPRSWACLRISLKQTM